MKLLGFIVLCLILNSYLPDNHGINQSNPENSKIKRYTSVKRNIHKIQTSDGYSFTIESINDKGQLQKDFLGSRSYEYQLGMASFGDDDAILYVLVDVYFDINKNQSSWYECFISNYKTHDSYCEIHLHSQDEIEIHSEIDIPILTYYP